MLSFFQLFENMNGKTYIAYHGTRSEQPIHQFSLPASFAPNVDMAKRYIDIGGSYTSAGTPRLYKVEIFVKNYKPYSTQDRLREGIMKFRMDRKFRMSLKQEGIDAFIYGIPNLDSDCVIAPIGSPSQIKILDVFEFPDKEVKGTEYLKWAGL